MSFCTYVWGWLNALTWDRMCWTDAKRTKVKHRRKKRGEEGAVGREAEGVVVLNKSVSTDKIDNTDMNRQLLSLSQLWDSTQLKPTWTSATLMCDSNQWQAGLPQSIFFTAQGAMHKYLMHWDITYSAAEPQDKFPHGFLDSGTSRQLDGDSNYADKMHWQPAQWYSHKQSESSPSLWHGKNTRRFPV